LQVYINLKILKNKIMQIFTKKQQEKVDKKLKKYDHKMVGILLGAVLKYASKKQNNINIKK
jgi:hypothetical protein